MALKEEIVDKRKDMVVDSYPMSIGEVMNGPLREFCVSDFRQNQEYHIINVHGGGLFPLKQDSRKAGPAFTPHTARIPSHPTGRNLDKGNKPPPCTLIM